MNPPNGQAPAALRVIRQQQKQIEQLETELGATQSFLAVMIAMFGNGHRVAGAPRNIVLPKSTIEEIQKHYHDIDIQRQSDDSFIITVIPRPPEQNSPEAEPPLIVLP